MQMVGVDDAAGGVEYLYPNPPGPGARSRTRSRRNYTQDKHKGSGKHQAERGCRKQRKIEEKVKVLEV